jgi:4-hydroxybenzoate polyprenyltransferase
VIAQQTDPSIPPTLREALLSAFGYFIVAIACTLAGYAAGHQHLLPQRSEWPAFVLLFAVLFPAYANRAILYELKLRDFGDHVLELAWLKSFAIHVPALLLAEGGGLATLLFFYATQPPGSSFIRILTRIAVTAAPMYSMGGRLTARWPSENSLFGFLHRSFFPAFATCLTPFVFGYAGHGDTKCCVWSAGCVLFFWCLSFVCRVFRLALFGTICLILLAVEQVFWLNAATAGARCATVIFFGTLMTLAMGVSESWRVSTRVQRDDIFRKAGSFTPREKSLYVGCTNFATSLFLPCFLLTALHPSTRGLYLVTILILLIAQYCCWFIPGIKRKLEWPTIGIFSGLLLPIIITFETQFPQSDSMHWIVPFSADLSTTLGVIAADVLLLGALTTVLIQSISEIELPEGYSWVSFLVPPIPCVCVTGSLAVVLSILIATASHLASLPLVDKPRMAALNELYLCIALICFAVAWGNILYKNKLEPILHKQRASAASARSDEPTRFAEIHRTIKGALMISRPTTSLIAGLLTGLIVFRGSGLAAVAIGAAFSITFATMFGFVLDDLCDLRGDRRTGKVTALTLNQLTVWRAKLLVCCVALLALASSPGGIYGRGVIALTLSALGAYHYVSRVLPTSKGFYTATITCVPLLYGALLVRLSIPVSIYGALWTFILGREFLIDADQANADRHNGLQTIAVRYGREATETFARVGMVLGLGLLVISANNWSARILAFVTFATVMWILYAPIPPSRRPILLRISLALGVCAIALAV